MLLHPVLLKGNEEYSNMTKSMAAALMEEEGTMETKRTCKPIKEHTKESKQISKEQVHGKCQL